MQFFSVFHILDVFLVALQTAAVQCPTYGSAE